jgi:type I restriction enzyme R subunit
VQLVMAGNDSEGLRYGTIGTPGEILPDLEGRRGRQRGYKLDKYLEDVQQGPPARADARLRAVRRRHQEAARVHQYFGVKAAQEHVQQRAGGIIWHTQGAGKSI